MKCDGDYEEQSHPIPELPPDAVRGKAKNGLNRCLGLETDLHALDNDEISFP